jgi:hypothetical protein
MAVQAVHAGVVKSVRAHEYVTVLRKGKLRQNLPQGLLA